MDSVDSELLISTELDRMGKLLAALRIDQRDTRLWAVACLVEMAYYLRAVRAASLLSDGAVCALLAQALEIALSEPEHPVRIVPVIVDSDPEGKPN